MELDTRFKAALDAARHVSEDLLILSVALLDPEIRERLRAGPVPARYRCGVCQAFGADFYTNAETEIDLTDPRWLVWIYHEVPKAEMTHVDELHYGDLANETYVRAIATYRAAGWDGEASPPDA